LDSTDVTLPDTPLLARQLIQFMRSTIPLAKAMDLQLGGCDADSLTLFAPLQPNINDKGCAFGGSLVSVMTLSGWALVELALRQRGDDCDVFVGESTVRYLSPVWADFTSVARLPVDVGWAGFFRSLDSRGKARIEVSCVIPGDSGKPAATLIARFVAKRRAASAAVAGGTH
jgi:thioesterase domain-containing protein